jgi:MGT family glycosyltransferase
MKRFLFVVPPLTGHVNPTVSVARELTARGHEVAWVGHPRRVRPLLPAGAELIALDDGVSDDVWAPVLTAAKNVRGLESIRFLWEDVLVPLARGMLAGVLDAIESFGPDLVIVDHQAIAGALAARRTNKKWATLATTSASVVDPFAALPKVKAWVDEQLAGLQRGLGLAPVPEVDVSPDLVVVFSTEELVGADAPKADKYRFVGPALGRVDETAFPWDRLHAMPRPRILVSLGTVSGERGDRFYTAVTAAFAGQPVQVVLVAPPGAVPNVPENFIVEARVPQLALLPHLDAVVCHGGHNTVCESLAEGLPLVVAPIRDDQPLIANQVVSAGAGVRVNFARIDATGLRKAVTRVLEEPEFRASAARLRASFHAAGGARAAATLLEEQT